MRHFTLLSYTVLAVGLASGCTSQTGNNTKILPSADTRLVSELSDKTLLRIQKNPASAQKSFLRAFDKLALNDTVTRQQVQEIANAQTAKARAVVLQQLMSLDTNGDSQITAQEMLSVNNTQITQWRNNSADYLPYSEADENKDDVISLEESFIFAQKYAANVMQSYQPYETMLVAFDTNDNGTITRDEVKAELALLGAEETSNNHNKLRSGQQPKLRKTQNRNNSHKAYVKPAPAACTPSAPEKNAEVIFLSGYQGSGLSSVALTGQDRETEVARLVIEKGSRPLYIMASSHTPLIWSIEGDTKRVEKFIAGRNRFKEGAGVGVVGLPKGKVEFLGRNCLSYFSKVNDSKAILAKAKWGKLINREPDSLFGAYTINAMKLPSGTNTPKKRRRLTIVGGDGDDVITVGKNNAVRVVKRKDKQKDFGLYRYTIEGLIEVDVNAVIAPEPVEAYDVFPQQAGLVQLVETGQLEPLERGSFRIVKPITRFPAGLNGGHSVKFILGKGVPLPKGSPGHSSVYSEESGECLSRSCR